MSLENRLPFVEKLEVPTLKLRYFAFNCFEIKLPGGKTLVIDPCLAKEGKFSCGYDETDLEACDFVYVNHTHGDHVATLGKVYDRFEPLVLAHERVSFDLAEFYDIPCRQFFPFESGQTYDFKDFKIQIIPGRHNDIGKRRPSGKMDDSDSPYAFKGMKMEYSSDLERRLSEMGTMYNYNFLLTLPNNLRIGFIAGSPGMEPQDETIWSQLQPDIVMAQRARWGYPDWQEKMAHVLEVTKAQLLLPLHIEDSYRDTYDPEEYAAEVNKLCAEKGLYGRMMFMQRAKWYELSTGIKLV